VTFKKPNKKPKILSIDFNPSADENIERRMPVNLKEINKMIKNIKKEVSLSNQGFCIYRFKCSYIKGE
tara:strand:- start:302 stop:505 length:204 start_codon:yes stop_codon:yes gene_type:complete